MALFVGSFGELLQWLGHACRWERITCLYIDNGNNKKRIEVRVSMISSASSSNINNTVASGSRSSNTHHANDTNQNVIQCTCCWRVTVEDITMAVNCTIAQTIKFERWLQVKWQSSNTHVPLTREVDGRWLRCYVSSMISRLMDGRIVLNIMDAFERPPPLLELVN